MSAFLKYCHEEIIKMWWEKIMKGQRQMFIWQTSMAWKRASCDYLFFNHSV